MSTVEPGLWPEMLATRSSPSLTGWPSMVVMMSPALRPALAAGWPAAICADDDAGLESVDAGDGAGQIGLEADADAAADDLVLGADELVVDVDDGVGRHGEADAFVAGRLRVDGGVDADDFAGHIDERAAGVAGIDGGIGLEEVLELAGSAGLDGAVLAGDDAGGDGFGEAERLADGDDPVADFDAVGVAHFDGGQRGVGLNLDDGDVGGLVDADDFGGTALVAFRIAGEA